jgi:predicted DNA-binding ribbon-helix-helix protein
MSGFATGRPQKRSFSIKGHRTSISLEPQFWDALKIAAAEDRQSLSGLINRIDDSRGAVGLSSAVRVWLLLRLESKVRESHRETA